MPLAKKKAPKKTATCVCLVPRDRMLRSTQVCQRRERRDRALFTAQHAPFVSEQ